MGQVRLVRFAPLSYVVLAFTSIVMSTIPFGAAVRASSTDNAPTLPYLVEVRSRQVSFPAASPLMPNAQCTPGLHSRFIGQSPWVNLGPGQEADLWGDWQNIGCDTWDSRLRVGTTWPIPGENQPSVLGGAPGCATVTNWSACDRVAPDTTPVVYGQVVRFSFRVRAPQQRGSYYLYLRPLIEGVQWMEDEGVHWQVNTRLYDRAAAHFYADNWSSNSGFPIPRNNAYPSFGNDCQNFVSQVLYAGGLPELGNTVYGCRPLEWFRPVPCPPQQSQDCFTYGFEWTQSWTVATCQYEYFQTHGAWFLQVNEWSAETMSVGDVLHMDTTASGTQTHSRIFVGPGTDEEDGVYYAQLIDQHTAERRHRRWDLGIIPGMLIWKWHVTY